MKPCAFYSAYYNEGIVSGYEIDEDELLTVRIIESSSV